jgi:hypothetical protein
MWTADKASARGEEAADSEALQTLGAVGVVALGVVHLLIGWLALQLAWSAAGSEEAAASGAFATLAEQPLGTVLLWVVTLGLVALVVWQLSEAAFGHHGAGDKRTLERVKSGAKAVAYGALAVTAGRFAIGQGSSSGESQRSWTARLLDAPAGQILVGVIGLAVVALGGYLVYKGAKKKFLEQLQGQGASRVVVRLGQAGYIAKGIAYGLLGVLVVVAAVQHDPEESGGLDTALQTLRAQPYGQWMLTAVALGLVAYGVYCFARARAMRADAKH